MKKLNVAAVITVGLSALALGACGATINKTPVADQPVPQAAATPAASAPAPVHATPASTPAPAPVKAAPATVGSTIAVSVQSPGDNDSKAMVKLVQIVDPAQGADQFTTPDPGKRFVGVEFQITAGGPVSDDANSDAVLVGSNNQDYTPDFNSIAEGTNFNNGEITLATGGISTGWVTFQVPVGVKVASVQFGESMMGTVGQWAA
jgi:hypothetical protein